MFEKLVVAIMKAALGSPLYFLFGCFEILRAVFSAMRSATGIRTTLADAITCPHGHANPTTGRFQCLECKAVYLGWVGKCPVCGAGASYISCETCGVAVILPWERR
jgi:hypothetical protein